MKRLARIALLAAMHLVTLEVATADERFASSEAMIPMRDGVKLHVKIFRPEGQQKDLPIIFNRTPYDVANAARKFDSSLKTLVDEGYIFVFQDIRGKFGSEGTFVMQRPAPGRRGHQVPRRGDRRLRHDRVAAQERPAQQRPGRDARRLLRRLDHDHECPRAAPCAQGDLAAGIAGRHVARRRLPPQRRVPAELRLRIRRR